MKSHVILAFSLTVNIIVAILFNLQTSTPVHTSNSGSPEGEAENIYEDRVDVIVIQFQNKCKCKTTT